MTNENVQILCVDDEENVLKALRRLFMDDEYDIITVTSGEEGLEALNTNPDVQLVISDYRMPGMNGVDFLKEVCVRRPDTVRLVLSGYADTAAIVAAINEGQIYKFIAKPWNDDDLRVTIAKALELYFLQKENSSLTMELQDSNEELRLMNENLEKIVKERTQEVIFQNKALATGHFMLDSLPVGVIGVDLNDLVVKFNKSAAEILAEHGAIHVGMEAGDVLPAALQQMLASLQKNSPILQENIELGSHRVRLTGSYMKSHEGQVGKILVLTADLS
ncbi:MAG: response regulator [Proteobacteria bacterium]|nr:response regulator [Pseudomonadota bacterium]MBU1640464.1 response regulator [Pseudomonadota bacterium]